MGVDNLNDAYDPRLKHWRLAGLTCQPRFRFHRAGHHRPRRPRAALPSPNRDGRPAFAAVVNLARPPGCVRASRTPGSTSRRMRRHAQPAGSLPAVRRAEVPAGLDVEPLRRAQPGALPRGRRHEPAAVALRGLEEGRRDDRLHLPSPARPRRVRVPLLHGLRSGGPARHERLPLHPPDRRGRADRRLRRRHAERDFTYVDDIARARSPRSATVGLRGHQPRRRPAGPLSAVIDEIGRLVGRKPTIERRPAHPADVPATWADIGKAGHCSAGRRRCRSKKGSRRAVEWYRENRELALELEAGRPVVRCVIPSWTKIRPGVARATVLPCPRLDTVPRRRTRRHPPPPAARACPAGSPVALRLAVLRPRRIAPPTLRVALRRR